MVQVILVHRAQRELLELLELVLLVPQELLVLVNLELVEFRVLEHQGQAERLGQLVLRVLLALQV